MAKYTLDNIRKALDEVTNGSSIAEAARKHNIPRTTLSSKHNNVYPVDTKKGPASVLSELEEKQLEIWILYIGDMGFPPTKSLLLDSVQQIVKAQNKETPFTNGRPGRKWYNAFLRRHPVVAERMNQHLTKARSEVTEEDIRKWFSTVRSYLESNNWLDVLDNPDRIFNMDESAFLLCPKEKRVLARKGEKLVYSFVHNDEKECITTLFAGSASGKQPPPMVIYSYQRLPAAISEKFPKDWALGRSETGWMNGETFFEYVANIFHPWIIKNKIQLPVILFVDGHASHLTLHLCEFCKKNQIILVALYPNATHIYQPMDVSVFRPLKVGWLTAVSAWRLKHYGDRLKREEFAPLLEEVKTFSSVLKPKFLVHFRF